MAKSEALAVVPANGSGTAMATMQGEVVLHDPAMEFVQTLPQRWQLAKMLHASGMSRQKSPEGVMAVVLKGYELGLPPMAALSNLDFFDGNFVIRAHAQLAIASARYGVTMELLESTTTTCRLRLRRPRWEPVEESYTIEEAKVAGLLGKNNWKNYPKDMLYNRALSRGIKRICPEVGAGVFDPDEVGGATGVVVPGSDLDASLREVVAGEVVDTSSGEVVGEAATPAQLQLIERVMQSHVFTAKEKNGLQKRIDRGMTKEQASEAADWLTTQVKERKAAEKDAPPEVFERREPGEEASDEDSLLPLGAEGF